MEHSIAKENVIVGINHVRDIWGADYLEGNFEQYSEAEVLGLLRDYAQMIVDGCNELLGEEDQE